MNNVRILEGDWIDRLQDLPDNTVQTCVTSPPYWRLRDYEVDGQAGLEATPEEYIQNMTRGFREVRRVLREDGTLWLNIDDTYNSAPSGGSSPVGDRESRQQGKRIDHTVEDLKKKDMVGIPWRLALSLRDDGWYLRSDIIWHKPNAMPESAGDRPAQSYEHVFLLSKSRHYLYDLDAIKVDKAEATIERDKYVRKEGQEKNQRVNREVEAGEYKSDKRNRRDVWSIPTKPYPGPHYAVFPPDLPRPCIKAGTSAQGECPECGAPWTRVVEHRDEEPDNYKGSRFDRGQTPQHRPDPQEGKRKTRVATDQWESGCDHDRKPVPQTVLDPFSGAGTTGLVATRLRRNFIGIELNPEDVKRTRDRIESDAPMLTEVTVE